VGVGERSQTLDLNLHFFTSSLRNLPSLSVKLKEHLPKNISFSLEKKMLEAIENVKEATTFAIVGTAIGGFCGFSVFNNVGGAGLAIGGTAYPVTCAAFTGTGAIAGALTGLAVYGLKKSVLG
jgi:hypothetical protein